MTTGSADLFETHTGTFPLQNSRENTTASLKQMKIMQPLVARILVHSGKSPP